MKYLAFGVLIFALVLVAVIVDVDAKNPSLEVLSVEGLYLSDQYVLLKSGQSEVLLANVYPYNANNQTVLWESEDPSVAQVEGGIVTGLKRGTTKVIATAQEGGYRDYCFVDVIY